MKIKLQHILLSFGLAITPAGAGLVYGQDTGTPLYDPYDPDMDRERDRIMYSPGETDPVNAKSPSNSTVTNSPAAPKDSAAVSTRPVQRNVKPASEPPKNTSKPKGEDDSILSFNFLYYIIQKYKLQDIVD
jgi:hypothetical protein